MQSCRGRAVMHHTVRQSRIYHSCTHKISENTTIKTNSDTNIMLKDDQNSIQVRESTCQAEWYTMVSVCMWSDQNNHAKIRINALSNTKWSINIISISKSQMNISMKHRENSYLRILYQDESIIIISMSTISNKYINEAQRKSLCQNLQSR